LAGRRASGHARRGSLRSLPSSRGRGTDGGRHHRVDAGPGGGEPRRRQPRLLDAERGARQGAAVRRLRSGRDRSPSLVQGRRRSGARRGHPACGRHRPPRADRAGGADGRRVSQPEPRRVRAAHQGARPGDRGARSAGHRAPPHPRLRGVQRASLLERRDGRVQGGARRRPQGAGVDARHGDGAERYRIRDPRQRAGRPMVHRAGADAAGPLLSRIRPRRRESRHRRQRHHRDGRPRRLRDGRRPRRRAVRGRHAGRRARVHAAHVRDHARREHGLRLPPLDFRGTPTGIDVRLVVQTGILPQIDTGMAHREPGIGQVGAGLVKPPRVCFDLAFEALVRARAGAADVSR